MNKKPLIFISLMLSTYALLLCITPCVFSSSNEDTGDYILIANNNILRGKFDEAMAVLNELINRCDVKRDKTDCALAYYLRGKTYEHKGNIDYAISDFSSAIKIDSRYLLAYYNRAVEYQKRLEFDKAIADYSKIIEIDSKQAHSYNNRAMIYDQIGNFELAISDFDKAIEINPGLVHARFNRGLAYIKKGDYYKALDDFTRELEIYPHSSSVECYMLAVSHFCKKEYDECWKQIDRLQAMRYTVSPAFLADLKKASGREK